MTHKTKKSITTAITSKLENYFWVLLQPRLWQMWMSWHGHHWCNLLLHRLEIMWAWNQILSLIRDCC